jgi:hypothetical protein
VVTDHFLHERNICRGHADRPGIDRYFGFDDVACAARRTWLDELRGFDRVAGRCGNGDERQERRPGMDRPMRHIKKDTLTCRDAVRLP